MFVGARIYTRLIRLRQKLDWSDYLLILSAIDAMARASAGSPWM